MEVWYRKRPLLGIEAKTAQEPEAAASSVFFYSKSIATKQRNYLRLNISSVSFQS